MLQLNDISKSFTDQTLFEDISLQISEKTRLGLIGRNGCGKSTLLKIIMGQMEIDSGSIYRSPGLRISCLSQEPCINPEFTLEEEIRSGFLDLNALQAQEEQALKDIEHLTGEPQMAAIERLDLIHRQMHTMDAQDFDARISKMVTGLGFSLDDLNRSVSEFSGGWQMRINLAKVLLEGADILMMDEPTNHLDLEACEWLEGFLKQYPGGLVVVSHDRRFLDEVCKQIAEVELGKITVWTGNYTSHLQQKADEFERLTSASQRQQKDLAKQTAFVERFRASATKSTQAKSREKQLAKIERLEAPKTDNQRMNVRFPVPQASGKQVLTFSKVSKAFGENKLFKDISADIHRSQRIFLLGANGCGKTTLLRLIVGTETLDGGKISRGHNVNLGYFSQNQLETLDANLSVFDTLHHSNPKLTKTEIRGLLARFLFIGDEVFKPVSVLSGGEKSKLALAKLMLSGPNMLLLDEPTNHMDIPAKEVLEDAFKEYEGSILCISHDRYFIENLATDIWEFYEGHLLTYPGDYDYYLSKREETREKMHQALRKGKQAVQPASSDSDTVVVSLTPLKALQEIEKKIKKVEKAIIALETEIEELAVKMALPEVQQNYQVLSEMNATHTHKQGELSALNAEWESLTESLTEAQLA